MTEVKRYHLRPPIGCMKACLKMLRGSAKLTSNHKNTATYLNQSNPHTNPNVASPNQSVHNPHQSKLKVIKLQINSNPHTNPNDVSLNQSSPHTNAHNPYQSPHQSKQEVIKLQIRPKPWFQWFECTKPHKPQASFSDQRD